MTLTETQQNRLSQIGGFLIEEGFSDLLVDTGLLPQLGFFDRLKISLTTVGSSEERFIKFLEKVGPSGIAFAFFAAHRSDLFSSHLRDACSKLCDKSRNQVLALDSQTALALLKKLDGKTKYEQLPFLVTPFATYYRSSKTIAKLFHKELVNLIHDDIALIHNILTQETANHSRLLMILLEFADFVVDYFEGELMYAKKHTSDGLIVTAWPGTLVGEVATNLKVDTGAKISTEIMNTWLSAVFDAKKILYDTYFWQWSSIKKKIYFVDAQPVITISDKDKKTLLTYFSALHFGDEQTAAACLLNMCESTDATLDLAERLVSLTRANKAHVFEAGIAILNEALSEGIQIKIAFAKMSSSATQVISLIKQYSPQSQSAFDKINQYLAHHNIITHTQIIRNEESKMEPKKSEVVTTPSVADQSIDRLAKEIDKSSNRIAYSAIIAAFTIAGALLIANASQNALIILGVPFFIISFLTALLLISSIMKEPK